MLVVFDYVVTFGAEVEHYWRRKVTGATVLFFTNRYVLLFLYLLSEITPPYGFGHSDQVQLILIHFSGVVI